MILNETNPPLDEALMHYGVKGMRWGRRRARSSGGDSDYDYDDANDYDPQSHDNTKKKIATGVLIGVGAAATLVVLHKTGHLKMASDGYKKFSGGYKPGADGPAAVRAEARRNFEEAFGKRESPFKNRSFRPKNVGNPLFTVHPKSAKDFVDSGFGTDGVFNVTTMTRGTKKVKDFGPDIWDVPMLALTSGRRR